MITAENITDEQIRELRDNPNGDGDTDFITRQCDRALTTEKTITDDQIERFVRAKIAEAAPGTGKKSHWLGMGDEALADESVGAPYKLYCRREIAKAYAATARARCAEILNARAAKEGGK